MMVMCVTTALLQHCNVVIQSLSVFVNPALLCCLHCGNLNLKLWSVLFSKTVKPKYISIFII